MRVYNGTNSQLVLPLSPSQNISIAPKSVSGDIMPSNEFISLLVTSFKPEELALIVTGPFEINMCSTIVGSVEFVVQSIDEAVKRFAPEEVKEVLKEDVGKPKKEEVTKPKKQSTEVVENTKEDEEKKSSNLSE